MIKNPDNLFMNFLKGLTVFFWIGLVTLVAGIIHSWHFADLSPDKNSTFKLAKFIETPENYGVVHFLTPECGCSVNIYKHLMERGPYNKNYINESVVIVDDNELEFTKNLKGKGFKSLKLDLKNVHTEFSKSIKGVPLLVIFDQNKKIQYVGGYADRSITPFSKIDIKSYISGIKEGRKIASKPVIGCAVSKKYKDILDPFGLKYRKQ